MQVCQLFVNYLRPCYLYLSPNHCHPFILSCCSTLYPSQC